VLRSADRLARNEPREREEARTTAEERSQREPRERTRRRGSMDRAEIETRVKKVLAEQLAVDEQQVVPDARFAEDLNADSLDLVEAVLALEEEWSIEIPEDEMESVKTVGQAVDLVASKLGMS
jgi:acyl carrier protein